MKLREIFRFELAYQGRRPTTWLLVAAVGALIGRLALEAFVAKARRAGYHFNAPFQLAELTLMGSALALLLPATVAGDAATRDLQTRLHPLIYAAPLSKGAYLGGRLLAALALHAAALLVLPAALLLAGASSSVEPELLAPVRVGPYAAAYLLVALPSALVATTLLFALSVLARRALVAWLGAALLFALSLASYGVIASAFGRWDVARLFDPLGLVALAELSRTSTAAQKDALAHVADGLLTWPRLVWPAVAAAALALAWRRFRFAHPPVGAGRAERRAN
ncbi:hypothetical protein PYV61_17970, partial [Roseisolibacter sp. H3M3-2]|nr:hypothetical protein [Roseisolibacter sp. H3M3-2]